MIRPLQITFRNIPPSAAVATRIRMYVAKLDRYYERITSCRVTVEAPHRHHKRGDRYLVRIQLCVPGEEIVVNHAPESRGAVARCETGKITKQLETGGPHKDLYLTIHDAFRTVRRLLEDHVRRLRWDVKAHSRPAPLRLEKHSAEIVAVV